MAVSLGLMLAVWMAYNLLVQRQPEAEGSVRGTIGLAVLFLWVGGAWLRGRPPKRR